MSQAANNNVIGKNSTGASRAPGARLLTETQGQFVELVTGWIKDVGAPIAEELFELADSTRERLKQTRYLDLRMSIDKGWSNLVSAFRKSLTEEANTHREKALGTQDARASALEIPDFQGLSLVDDADLSEHLVIRELGARLSETCDNELYLLDRRVAALLGLENPDSESNPLAPGVVCAALSTACSDFVTDIEARLILLRRLERHLHQALPALYQKINAALAQRGILPDLVRSYRRTTAPSGPAGGKSGEGPTASAIGGGGVASASTAAISESFIEVLQRLALARTAGGEGIAVGNAPAGIMPANGAALSPAEAAAFSQRFFASLDDIQHASPITADMQIINRVREVRDSETARNVGGLEAVTIDIVATLFDFIFDDGDIPVAVKALISRLQIPVLKIAMLNHGFFADRQHPARRFLSDISGIADRWGSHVDESDPFYIKLSELVERIQSGFETDVDVFSTALSELENFVEEREKDEERTTQTAATVVIRSEHLAEAQTIADSAVQTFLMKHEVLPLLKSFFLTQWAPVLKKTALDHGEGSEHWLAATGVMEDLAWSIEAKKQPDDRLKLINLLPRLLAQLNKGLDSVGADLQQRESFFDKLVQCHSGALKGEAPTPLPTAPESDWDDNGLDIGGISVQETEGELRVTCTVEQGVEIEEVVLVGASPVWHADERDLSQQVAELKRGDWIEFREDDGKARRERLNWVSPQRGILLFSNHSAAKAISIAPDALVRQLRDGKARFVSNEPAFERALSGVLESIKTA